MRSPAGIQRLGIHLYAATIEKMALAPIESATCRIRNLEPNQSACYILRGLERKTLG